MKWLRSLSKAVLIPFVVFVVSNGAWSASTANILTRDSNNVPVNGGTFSTSAPAPANGQVFDFQIDQAANLKQFPGVASVTLSGWTSTTALNATQNIFTNSGASAVVVQLTQTSTITGGAITFEVTWDGTNWSTITSDAIFDPTTANYPTIAVPYTLQANSNKQFVLLTKGSQGLRIKLSTQITGTATVTPNYTLLPFSPLSQTSSSLNTNVVGTLTNNNAAPGANNLGVLPALVNTAAPAWTNGNQSLVSVNGSGELRSLLEQGGNPAVITNATPSGAATYGLTVRPYAMSDGTNTMPTGDAAARTLFARVNDGTNNTTVVAGNAGITETGVNALRVAGEVFGYDTSQVAGSQIVPIKAETNNLHVGLYQAANEAQVTNAVPSGAAQYGLTVRPYAWTDGTNVAPTMDATARRGFQQLTDGTTNVTVIAGTNALKTDLASVAGTATVTASAGIIKAGVVGNAGGVFDAAGQNVASPANELLVGGQFNTTPTTILTGNMSPLQLDNAGNLLIKINANGASGTNQNVNIAQVNGSAVTTSATGQMKVGIVGNAGASMDAAGQNVAAPANELLTGCVFNTTPTTVVSGNMTQVQCDNVGDTLVKVNAALPTGANTIGAVTQASGPWTSNLTQVNGAAISTAATGTQKVGVVGNAGAIFDAATNAAPPANILYQGVLSGNALPTAVTVTNTVALLADKFGRGVTLPFGFRDLQSLSGVVTLSNTTETTLIAAVVGTFLDMTAIACTNSSATATNVKIRDATAGTIRWQFDLAANGGAAQSFTYPLVQSAVNNNWTVQLSGAVTSVDCVAQFVSNK